MMDYGCGGQGTPGAAVDCYSKEYQVRQRGRVGCERAQQRRRRHHSPPCPDPHAAPHTAPTLPGVPRRRFHTVLEGAGSASQPRQALRPRLFHVQCSAAPVRHGEPVEGCAHAPQAGAGTCEPPPHSRRLPPCPRSATAPAALTAATARTAWLTVWISNTACPHACWVRGGLRMPACLLPATLRRGQQPAAAARRRSLPQQSPPLHAMQPAGTCCPRRHLCRLLVPPRRLPPVRRVRAKLRPLLALHQRRGLSRLCSGGWGVVFNHCVCFGAGREAGRSPRQPMVPLCPLCMRRMPALLTALPAPAPPLRRTPNSAGAATPASRSRPMAPAPAWQSSDSDSACGSPGSAERRRRTGSPPAATPPHVTRL